MSRQEALQIVPPFTEETVELGFPVPMDANGIADGLHFAQVLLGNALRHVSFYTNGCRLCTTRVLEMMVIRYLETATFAEGGQLAEQRVLDSKVDEGDRTEALQLHRNLIDPVLRDLLLDWHRHAGFVPINAPHGHA
jgi:hypothetical protein